MTANVQISGKAANGIIFVVGGDNLDDFRVNLAAAVGDMAKADAVINEAVKLIVPPSLAGAPAPDQFQQAAQNVQNAFPGSQPQQEYQPQQNQQRKPTPPPGQQAPLCNHGTQREWVTGVSKKTNKAWKMWACPMDRDSQCEPVWVR